MWSCMKLYNYIVEQLYRLWKMKATRSSRILKTIYHNGSYLFLFGKRKLQSFEIS